LNLMKKVRKAIEDDCLTEFRNEFFANYNLEGRNF